MSRTNEEKASIAHRIGTWVVVVPMALYVLQMGQWVGAADEKFEDVEEVEAQVDDLKQRLVRLETDVQNHDDNSAKRSEALLRAIEKLERKIDEME